MSDYVKDLRSLVGNKEVILGCACGCIENEQGEILLQQRNDSGKWGFLGGIMELGESAEETVIREVWEESGLQVRVTKLLGVYSKYFASYPNGDKAQPIVVFFSVPSGWW